MPRMDKSILPRRGIQIYPWIYQGFLPMLDEKVGKIIGKDGHVWRYHDC